MQKKSITFEPFTLYFQNQNSIFEQIKRTIIDMTRTTFLREDLIIIYSPYMKNYWLIRVLQNLRPHEAYTHKLFICLNFKYLAQLFTYFYIKKNRH